MTTYHKILSADKTELRRIAIQTAELNQKMYAMLEECLLEMTNLIDEVNDQRCAHVNLSTLTQPDLCDGETLHRIQKLLAEARGE